MNREDLLKTAYEIEEIAGYTSGVAFRLSIVDNKSVKKAAIQKEFEELLKATLDLVYRLNEMVRSLSINPSSVIDIAIELQKIERQTDLRYRNLVKMVIKDITSPKEAMLLKDAAEHIEAVSYTNLRAHET